MTAPEALEEVAATYRTDALLFPSGLLAPMAAADQPWAALLVLPLVGLFVLLSREREARIAHAVELSHAYRGTALVLRDVLEEDDAYTGRHTEDVVELAVEVADALAVDEETRRTTELGALLHDVCKIAVPNAIVNKPGPLDATEWGVMRTHTVVGQRMLEQVGGLLGPRRRRGARLTRALGRRGLPGRGRARRHPPPRAHRRRLDAYNAMVTDRPYRAAPPPRVAVGELRANAGTQFDPAVVEALLRILPAGRFARAGSGRSPSLP